PAASCSSSRRPGDDVMTSKRGDGPGVLQMAAKKHRIFTISVASVYPHYLAKAQKKGRTQAEVDEIFRWLTGYSQKQLDAHLAKKTTFEDFFAHAPMNPARALIKGVV